MFNIFKFFNFPIDLGIEHFRWL
uniref:Uncharacterized protein n=1 Tax=Rhizophora mucronata TaxID=61149 RepID=A0A2P2N3W1_RHIMU